MAQARAVINIDVNTSAAATQLRALQNQINSFSATLSKNNLVQAEAAQRFSSTLMDAVSSTRFFTAEQVRMETAARRLDQTLSKGKGTLGQYFNARFRKDSAEAASVLSLANSRAQALQTTFYETTAAAKGFRDVIAVRPLAAFNTEAAVANERLAIHRAMLRQATTSMINFGKNTQWAGRQLMVGFTVPLAIFGGAAAKTFKEIEQAAVRFKKVYGDAFTPPEEIEANMRAIEALALEYTKYGIAVKDTIGLAAEAAAAGAQNAQLISATTEATRLATLGQMEQNEALEATIALQNAFRMSGEELTKSINFLNMVENQTVVTLQDLASAIPRVAPVIVGLGGDVKDLAAMLAAMQEGGVSAAQGANALKSGLGSLINPTKKANDTLAQMGINLNAIVQANRGDLMGTVQAFGQALATLDQFSRQQALEEVFGKYQYARLGALFDNIIKDGTQASRVLQLAGLSAEDMAKSAEKELRVISEATSTKYMAAIERFKMAIAPIGELFMKISTPIINFFSKLFEMFDRLPDGVKNFTALATVIVGVVVPAGTMFLGLLMNLVGTLVKFGSVVAGAVKGFGQAGFAGAIQAVSQSLKYMSLEEMDAATAAQQLGIATQNANTALVSQITSADKATAAFTELAAAINLAAAAQNQYAQLYPATFVPGSSAAQQAQRAQQPNVRRRNKGGPIFLNEGNTVPGVGNKDTVPAMLTPGEFVVNKKATQENLPLLYAINNGAQVPGFNTGGGVAKFGKMFYGMKIQPGSLGLDLENIPPAMLARLLELRGAKAISSGLPTQSSTAGQNFVTLPQLTAQQRADLTSALQAATPRLQGVNPVQLLGNLVGAGPRRINSQARFGKASKEEMAFLSGLSEFYLPAFTSVPSAKAALQALKLSPTEAADRLASTLGQRFLSKPGMRVSDTQIYDEVAKGFDEAGLSSIYSALINDKNAIRYTMPTEVSNELRKIMVTGAGNANVHEQLLTRAFGRQSVTNFRDSQGRPGYVVSGSQLGLSKDLLLMPGQTYPTGTGMSYEDIPLTSVQRMLQDTFIRRGYSVSESDIQRMHLGMNKGGMIPGMQYFAQSNPGRVVLSGTDRNSLMKLLLNLRETFWVKSTAKAPSQLSDWIPTAVYRGNEKEVQDALLLARKKGWITGSQEKSKEFQNAFKTMLGTDLSHIRKGKTRKVKKGKKQIEEKQFSARTVTARPTLENMGLDYLFGIKQDGTRPYAYDIMSKVLKENPAFASRYSSQVRRIVDGSGHTTNRDDYEFLIGLFDLAEKSKNDEVKSFMSSKTRAVPLRWIPMLRALAHNKLKDKSFQKHQTFYQQVKQTLVEQGFIRANSGGLIDGVQYLVGGGPAIGATLRRMLAGRQRKILGAEPDQTLESAAQQYADHGYASLTAAQRVLLSQSREPFAGPQLFRGAGGSSPLIDRKLRDRLASGNYRDIIDLEGEMIPFPKGSWSTDERIAYNHMRYFASENQEWSNAIDMLTVRGSVPLYGSTYKEHIKGEQANVIRKIKYLKAQLKQAQDKMSPEAVAQEEARIEQLRLAVEQERKSARSKLGFTEDQDLTLTERAMISDTVRESKAQRDYDIAKKSHRTNLEYPTELQRRIDEEILSLYYKRNKRKQAFAEIERLRQQGSNVNVFFKATKSDRYIPPGQAKISYIQDLTKGDPNDPLTTKLYVIGLDMGYPEMVDISGKPFARYGGRTNEYEFIRQNKGGLIPIQNFNTGGVADPVEAFATRRIFESGGQTIVPGVGNTDTVPAMLTPGEFVINKKATTENLPLLHAINNGEVAGYVTGGEVRPWGGNQYTGPGWHVYDAANQKIKDPNTGKAIVFQTREEADAALKSYQDKVAERFKGVSGGKDISGQNDKLYPGKIEQDRNSPGDERFGKWVVYDDDNKEISRHQTLEQAKEGLAKFRQDSRKGLLASAKIPLTGKQKATMLVSTLGIAALTGTLGTIFATRGKDENLFGQSNITVEDTEPSKWTYLNDGNRVPGTGNKDTVPAMLTPGEFVVNKDATSQNLPLLHAINSGAVVPGYAVGGLIAGMATQMAVGTAGYMGGSALGGAMGGDSGAMVGGILGSIIPSLLLPAKLGGLLGAGGLGGGAIAGGLSAALLNPLTGPIAALAAAVIATTYTFYKLSESNQKEFEAGRRLADAMTTSASEIEALGTSARKRAENTESYLKQEEDDFIEAKYNRKIARAKTEAEKNRLRSEKELAMELAGGKTTVRENIDTFYKEQIARSKKADQVPSYLPITNAEKAAQPQTSELYSVRNRLLGLRFAKAGPEARDSAYGKSFIEGAGKEVFESVKAMRDLPNQFARGELSSAQYQAVLQTGQAAYGQNVNIRQISEKDLAAKLSQYILSGVMTQDQASSVAAAIGKEIKDSGFGERVANEVITVVGAEGAIAKYSPGVVIEKITAQSQRKVDEYQRRIEKTMPQFFAPDTFGSKATGVQGAAAAIGGPLALLGSQGFMDMQRTQARDEFLTRNATPTMGEMANWRETFFTSFFSGMADQLRRDMGGFLEASVANLQMLEENIAVVQVRYNDLISKATTIQEKDRLRYEQANQMADLEEKRIKAQEQIFAPMGGRQAYTQQVMQTTRDQQQTFGYAHNVGLDIFRGRLAQAQAAPVGINDITGSMANIGNIITNAFMVGAGNVNQAIIDAFGKAGAWLNKTGFGEGLKFEEIYATQAGEAFNKRFEGTQLGINVDSLSQLLSELGIVAEDSMDSQLFFIRQMGMQNEEAATKFTGMLVQAMGEIEAASPAGGEKAPGEFSLTEPQARAAQAKIGTVFTAGALPGGQQLNMETLTDISTAMPALGTENLLRFIDQMNMLGNTAPQTTERLAAAFAQMGDAINVTTTSGKSMFDMLMNNKQILQDDKFYENAIRGAQYFAEQTEEVRNALAKFITGPESYAAFGQAIEEANPKKFNRDLNLLESTLRRTTKSLKIPQENKKDWKYVLDTFNRIDKIKDPDIRAKLEAEIEPQVFTMMKLVEQLQSEQDAGTRQIIIDQIIEINQTIQTKVTGAEQDQKVKTKSGGGGGAKPDPLGEQMRMLRDQIHNQDKRGREIEASGERVFGTFDRLRQKMGAAATQGFGASLIDYFKSLDPKTALQVGKEVLNNQGKMNTLLSLMSQNAISAQREQTIAAKQRTRFLGTVVNAAPLAGQSMMYMSQMYADEEAMAQLDAAVAGAKNKKQANNIAKQFATRYAIQKQQEQQQRAILAPSQLQYEAGMNAIQYQGTRGLQETLGFTQEEASLAMGNQQVQALVENLIRNKKKISDLSAEERQSIVDFVNSQKTLQGEFNKAIDNVKDGLQGINTILQDSIQYIEEYNIKPLQDQIDSLQEKNSEYSEQSRRLSHALSKLQEKIRVESEKIQEKEKEVNEVYNNRISSLDKISRINERIANQQRGQLDLASALSRGDIAGAAQAALSMQQDYAQSQQEDARAALTEQRDSELKALQEERDNLKNMTIEYNGELLTTEQIQSRIDGLNEKIYQNSLLEYDIQKKITAEKERQEDLARQQAKVDKIIDVADRSQTAVNTESNQRADELLGIASAARLTNTTEGITLANQIEGNVDNLNRMSNEEVSAALNELLGPFMAAAGNRLGQDFSALGTTMPGMEGAATADSILLQNNQTLATMNTDLTTLQDTLAKDNPFDKLTEGAKKFAGTVKKVFSEIPKEPGSGGGTPDKLEKPGTTTVDSGIKITASVRQGREDAINTKVSTTSIDGKNVRITTYYGADGMRIPALTKYEVGRSAASPGGGGGIVYTEQKAGQQISGAVNHPISIGTGDFATGKFGGGTMPSSLDKASAELAFDKFAEDQKTFQMIRILGKDNILKALLEGINEGALDPSNQAQVRTFIVNMFKSSLGIASPAKEVIPIGNALSEGIFEGVLNTIKNLPGAQFLSNIITTFGGWITSGNGKSLIMDLGKSILGDNINGIFGGMIGNILNFDLSQLVTNLLTKLRSVFGIAGEGASSTLVGIVSSGKSLMSGLVQGAIDQIPNIQDFSSSLTNKINSLIVAKAQELKNTGKNALNEIISGITDASNSIPDISTNLLNMINKTITFDKFKATGSKILDKIKEGLGVAVDAMPIIAPLKDALKGALGISSAAAPPATGNAQKTPSIKPDAVDNKTVNRYSLFKSASVEEEDPATTLLSDFEEQMTTLADYANKFLSADTGLPYILSSLLAGMVDTVNGFFEHVKNVLNAITITIPPVKLSFAASGTGQDSKGNSVSWSVSGSGSTKEASTKISPLVTSVVSAQKKAFGGMISYKGSRERAPGMMFGGKMKKYAMGSFVPGIGSTDKVPALLTPGEFVVRKPVAQEIAPLLNAVNSNVFPKMNLGGVVPRAASSSDPSVQYNYNVEVNVAGTNASPDDIANAVISKINTVNDRQIRSIKINGNS